MLIMFLCSPWYRFQMWRVLFSLWNLAGQPYMFPSHFQTKDIFCHPLAGISPSCQETHCQTYYNLPEHLRSQCWLNHPESLKLSSVQHHHFKLNNFKLFSSLALKRINSRSETNGLTQNKQQYICLCNASVPDMNTDFIDSLCLQESGHEGSTSLFMGVLPEREVLEAVTHGYFNPPVKPCHSGVWLMAGGCFSDWGSSSPSPMFYISMLVSILAGTTQVQPHQWFSGTWEMPLGSALKWI